MPTLSHPIRPHLATARKLGGLLLRHASTVTTAESCTAGGCAQAITDVPGSSAWFDTGFVTYSNAAKMKQLGVPSTLLDSFGAVSREVVDAMVHGALQASGADFALAVSGIAGPTGGSTAKPQGTVWIAVGCASNIRTQKFHFLGDRTSVREQSVTAGLKNLLEFCAESLK